MLCPAGDGEHSYDRDDDPPRARADGFRHHRGKRYPLHAGPRQRLYDVNALSIDCARFLCSRTLVLKTASTLQTARRSTRSWTGGSRRLGHRRRSRRAPLRRRSKGRRKRAAGSPACARAATAQRSDPLPQHRTTHTALGCWPPSRLLSVLGVCAVTSLPVARLRVAAGQGWQGCRQGRRLEGRGVHDARKPPKHDLHVCAGGV